MKTRNAEAFVCLTMSSFDNMPYQANALFGWTVRDRGSETSMPDKVPLFELAPRARKSIQDTYNSVIIAFSLGIRWSVTGIVAALISGVAWGVIIAVGLAVNVAVQFLIRTTGFSPQTEGLLLTASKSSVAILVGAIVFSSVIAAVKLVIAELRIGVPEENDNDNERS